ncbi:MAG: pyridoxamine 5'-phosphate oxidase family protein [Proteobacteria bacterium]|nr:pyridoxamine 5'-phosphate oxidase family protein [Pseudomonadota bacterium]
MNAVISDIAFTPAVKAQQTKHGSRTAYEKMESKGGWQNAVTDQLSAFLAERDSFYLATATADGQPYIQHRGGKAGFLQVLDQNTLAFPDYGGNRQYITTGNLSENDKAYIFLMDYANRYRVKIWGRAEVREDDADLIARVTDLDDEHIPERVIVFHVSAWDRNCPQFITPRYDENQLAALVAPLNARIAELEAENAVLKDGHLQPA